MKILDRYFFNVFVTRVLAFSFVAGAVAYEFRAPDTSERLAAIALAMPFAAALGAATTFFELLRNDEIAAMMWCGLRVRELLLPGLAITALLPILPLILAGVMGLAWGRLTMNLALAEVASVLGVLTAAVTALRSGRDQPATPFMLSTLTVGCFYLLIFAGIARFGGHSR